MSWKSGKNGDRAKRTGWSGSPTSRDKPLHRWQDSTAAAEGTQIRRRRHRNRWVLVSVLALSLLAFLIWLLLPNSKSQLIVFTATNYAMPIPLNSWAEEDRKSLAELNNVNLLVTDDSEDWNKNNGATVEINQETIQQNQSRRRTPLIVYLSMHGVVADDGQPCLLPPGASIRDPQTWKRVEDVLNEIHNAVPETRNVLLILDCNRIRVNWNLGILYNSFSERVQQLVERKKPQRMAVLLAAGPGQVNWASSDLEGSAFGRYLQLGLAGAAADDAGSLFWGNDISLQELMAYLKRNVSAWSTFNRGESQTPLLIPADAEFHVAWGVSTTKLGELVQRLSVKPSLRIPEKLEAVQGLWQNLDELRKHDLVRFDPISCRNFEQELLCLEDLIQGGQGYAERADKELDRLKNRLSEAVTKAHAADLGSRALVDRLEITHDVDWARIPQAAHTLPTSEYFGACGATESKQIEDYWASLIDSNEAKAPNSDQEPNDSKLAQQLAETQFLEAIRRQQVRKLWKNSELPTVIELRQRAEQLAVPTGIDKKLGDERAHYYARYAAQIADQNRRLAEDVLFVGEQNTLPNQFDEYTTNAKRQYDWTEEVMSDSAQAFDIVDQASAETPYLASWLCSPLSAELSERDVLVREKLNPLIKNVAALSEEINQFKKPEAASRLPFRGRADQVLDEFDSEDGLKDRFKKEIDRLSNDEAQGTAGWRAIEALLTSPLIPGDARKKLLENRYVIANTLQGEFAAKTELQDKPESAEEVSYLSIMDGWQEHPLLEILRPDNAGVRKEDALGWCEQAAADVRKRLQQRVAPTTAASTTPSIQKNEVLQERQTLSLAERALRQAAPIGYGFTDSTSDPIADLRRFDLQQLLIWHARRAIDDFWGVVSIRGDEAPFFQLAATDYLQAATLVHTGSSTAIGDQIELLNQQLTKRLQAKGEPMKIEAKPDLVFDSDKPIDVNLTVGPNPKAKDYPPGFTAVFLRDPRDKSVRLPNVQFNQNSFLEPSKAAELQSFTASIPSISDSPNLDAVTFFRGREDVFKFPVRAIEGILIGYEPYQYDKQTITLSGDLRQSSSYVFIVDCSRSMQTFTDIEIEGSASQDTRMNLARKHLKTLLDDLALKNEAKKEVVKVGVLFYGHRAKRAHQKIWDDYEPKYKFFQKEMPLEFSEELILPEDTSYSHDVQEILTLGEFLPKDATTIEHRLDNIKPFGETPLYDSLIKAMSLFGSDNTRKGIIAITDGLNSQSESETSLKAVLDVSSPTIPIHILGFDLDAAKKEFDRLVMATNGSYAEVRSGAELLRELRKHLGRDAYTVREANSPLATLGAPIPIDTILLSKKQFTVEYRSIKKPVSLQGGEAIQLRVAQDGLAQDIVAIPYDQSVVKEADLIAGADGAPTDLRLRVHSPRRDSTSVTFPVSLQRLPTNRLHFTPRPAETWLEVTPLTNNRGQTESYTFYDVNFKKDEPVPVLEWTASGWDKWPDARHARIKFWCKNQKTPPSGSIPLGDLLSSPTNVGGAQLSAKAGVENGRFRIQITEGTHPPSIPIDAFRIQFETDPRAVLKWVEHQFDSKNRVARHSYYFDPGEAERVLKSNSSRILVTDAKAVKYGAFQLAGEGLEVPISKAGNLFSPKAAASGQ